MTPHCGTKPHCKTNWFHNVEPNKTVETDWYTMWNQNKLVPKCGTKKG